MLLQIKRGRLPRNLTAWVFVCKAVCVHILMELLPNINIMFEQPSGSWGFKQPHMLTLAASLGLWLGLSKDMFFYFVCGAQVLVGSQHPYKSHSPSTKHMDLTHHFFCRGDFILHDHIPFR